MEQEKILERVKSAWGGGRGGRIASITQVDGNPRMFTVTTAKHIDEDREAEMRQSLAGHGLKVMNISGEQFKRNTVAVLISEDLWQRMTGEEGDPKPSFDTAPKPITGEEELALLEAAAKALAERAADKERIAMLEAQLDRLTSAPDVMYIMQPLTGRSSNDEALRDARRDGYEIAHETFVSGADGVKAVYCARMERRAKVPVVPAPRRMIQEVSTMEFARPSSVTLTALNGGSRLVGSLADLDTTDLQPALDALDRALHDR